MRRFTLVLGPIAVKAAGVDDETVAALIRMKIALVHSPPYTPQGRGKIERVFRTVRSRFLPYFKGGPLEDLNIAFEHWIREDYHQRVHSSTGETPFDRFARHLEMIRTAPADLEDHFRKEARRRAAKDRTMAVDPYGRTGRPYR